MKRRYHQCRNSSSSISMLVVASSAHCADGIPLWDRHVSCCWGRDGFVSLLLPCTTHPWCLASHLAQPDPLALPFPPIHNRFLNQSEAAPIETVRQFPVGTFSDRVPWTAEDEFGSRRERSQRRICNRNGRDEHQRHATGRDRCQFDPRNRKGDG